MLVTLLSRLNAIAAPIEEVVRPRGFLLLGGFQQWASLAYEYNGHESSASNTGSRTNHFMEKYHADFGASIIDPHLLKLRLDGDVWLDQANSTGETSGSQSSNNVRYRYSFLGAAFDQKPYPITIISSRELGTVVTPLVPSFTTDSSQNGINVALLNNIVPVWFQFLRATVDTSGLRQDYSTTTDSVNLRAQHNISDFGHLEVNATVNSQNQTTSGLKPTASRSYGISVNNGLYFDREKRYTLASGLTMQSAKNGDIPQETLEWSENLTARFGKALQGSLTNWYRYNNTKGFDNREQIFKSNTVTGLLSHRLGESIESRIAGRYRAAEILDGTETAYGGTAGLAYRKKLPAASILTLNLSGEHEVTKRNITGTLLSIRDELHTGVQQGESVTLNVTGAIEAVGTVKDHDTGVTYTENEDYVVNLQLGLIDIIFGGFIFDGTNLDISYTVRINPSTKEYTTDTLTASGNLSLFKNRYRLAASLTESDQALTSGDAANANLNSTKTVLIHLDANYPANTLSLEYSNYASTAANYSYFEGGWRFNHRFPLGAVSLRARDRYTIYEPTAANLGHAVNTAELGSSFSRNLTSWAQLSLSANYVNSRGDNISRDYAYFRMNLQGRLNKVIINLIGQSIFRIRPTETIRDDHVRIELTRYF